MLFLFKRVEEDKPVEAEVVKGDLQLSRDTVVKGRTERRGKTESSLKTTEMNPSPVHQFDPNTIDKEGLVNLGLTPKQAQVIINYRNKGGKFKNAGDFSKIYVISPETYERVKNFISIDNNKANLIEADSAISVKMNNFEMKRPVQLNYADSTELVSLPGIGPYYAKKIIQYREKLGGFALKEQLLEIYGIDRERYDLFSERIVVDTNDIVKLDLNKATFEEISKNPYIGDYVARSIIRYREKSGAEHTDLACLVMNNIIKEELYKILKYYFM
ncbi:MAG: helix-hairpin-helix domain-containing protein [Bacteroidales bacterium]